MSFPQLYSAWFSMQMEVMMRERYIPAIIMLLAGAITSVINIINKVERVAGLKRLLLVIIIFYFIGLIAKAIIVKVMSNMKEKEGIINEEENQPEEKAN